MDYELEILDKNRWSISKNSIYYEKAMQKILVAMLFKDHIRINLDLKIPNEVIKLTNECESKGYYLFYEAIEYKVKGKLHSVNRYFFSYIEPNFNRKLKKNKIDIFKYLIRYCDYYNCHELIDESYKLTKKEVESKETDWYTMTERYTYPHHIREEYNTLLRQIKINKIFND